ncbi:class D sortase [Clostridium perfringens]|uniref:Class D sortase n=1 Tax=Clostridium perfringens TaxID=1502 RepID=G5DS66_CLOPF|nr:MULTISPECIES: class D sortase [Clostridium]AEP94907.1 sortase family protein [Clostridium perfringens]AFV15103.1 Sortase family protein [Clostridium perfringens]AQW28418.1 sortase [Clostridium perfringens]EGT3620385.1 class D sortase [Clostridium perfringens]EGT5620103.1 class D sortase [Clostridium perfringens]
MMKKAFITLIMIGILLIGVALFIDFKSKSIQEDLVQKYEEKMYSNSSVNYSYNPETTENIEKKEAIKDTFTQPNNKNKAEKNDVIGILEIDSIGVKAPIVLGEENLDYVVAKYRSSYDFGELGNVILAAHNNMRGSIFRNLHNLKIGSTVKIISDNKEFEYKITNRYIVEPNDTSKINFSNDKKEITLITCINHAKQRLILTGELK